MKSRTLVLAFWFSFRHTAAMQTKPPPLPQLIAKICLFENKPDDNVSSWVFEVIWPDGKSHNISDDVLGWPTPGDALNAAVVWAKGCGLKFVVWSADFQVWKYPDDEVKHD